MADKVLLVNAVFLAMTNENFKLELEEMVQAILKEREAKT